MVLMQNGVANATWSDRIGTKAPEKAGSINAEASQEYPI
jgi:hypothetical protein